MKQEKRLFYSLHKNDVKLLIDNDFADSNTMKSLEIVWSTKSHSKPWNYKKNNLCCKFFLSNV